AIVKALQPPEDLKNNSFWGKKRANAFLPYAAHPLFDEMAQDWLTILRLNIAGCDVFPHLVNLIGLHLLTYQLSIARQFLTPDIRLRFVCEMVAPKKTLVREIS